MKTSRITCLIMICLASLLGCKEAPNTATANETAAVVTPVVPPPPAKKEKFCLVHKVRQPTINTGRTTPVIILLHGLGSNEEDLFQFADGIDGRFMVISARAPDKIGVDQYSWYPLRKNSAGELTYQEVSVSIATRLVKQFVDEVKRNYSVDPFKIYLGGFSQGAILSLGTGLKYPLAIRGVACLSGEFYPQFEKSLNSEVAKRGFDIFISHGKKDAILPYEDMVESVKLLKNNDYKITEYYYDTGHTISQKNYQDFVNWLKDRP